MRTRATGRLLVSPAQAALGLVLALAVVARGRRTRGLCALAALGLVLAPAVVARGRRTRGLCALAALGLVLAPGVGGFRPALAASPGKGARGGTKIEYETVSAFSRIRVRRAGSVRTLIFVRDNGDEAEQSMVNLQKPHELLEPYSRYMFASYLFQPQPERVLIVGLGGAAMVNFLKHYDPQVHVDVVEIDPAVVKIADEYFECRTGGNIHVITADGVKYLETTEARYDVIYLDAFLKPTSETDATGTPLRMKTRQFYEALQSKLRPEGVVVFNVNRHSASDADLAAIRGAFPQMYVFRPNAANYVVVGTLAATREPATTLRTKAHEADSRFKSSFSFAEMTKHMLP